MSKTLIDGRARAFRAFVIAELLSCAALGCIDREPAGGIGEVAVRRSAATGAVCQPDTPCLTSDDDTVLGNLKIVNLFMSSDWDSDNAGTDMTRDAINAFTQRLVASSYFSAAATDYDGAGRSVSFGGAFDATGLSRGLCLTPSIGGVTDAIGIHAWITCMANAGPIPVSVSDLGLNATVGNIPQPDDGTLYVIYVPKGTNIVDKLGSVGARTCQDFGAYHFFTDVGKWDFDCSLNCDHCAFDFCAPLCCICAPSCGPTIRDQTAAYAVVPAECAGNMNGLMPNATHEIIEAAVDPIVPLGWLDRTSLSPLFPLVNGEVLKSGEVADICSFEGARPTDTVTMPDGNRVAPYWSTSAPNGAAGAGACYPPGVSAKCQDVTVTANALTCSAAASIDAGSSDPNGGALTLTQSPPGPYGLGTSNVTLIVSSTSNNSGACSGKVTVVDVTPPVLSPPPDVTVTVDDTPVLGTPIVMDACPGTVTVTNDAPAKFAFGVTTVTWTAADAAGNVSTATQTVTVTCPGGPNCSGHGTCDQGTCICAAGFTGHDCSINCGATSQCPDGNACNNNSQCGTRRCVGGICIPPPCAGHCTSGAPCGANSDCGSQVCTNSTCQPPACSPHCAPGAACSDNGNCSSFVCTGATNTCGPPRCSPNCNQGAPCGDDSDCRAQVCENGLCQPPACSPSCGTGELCNSNGDCRSRSCSVNHCR
jgi:hypothetical protein